MTQYFKQELFFRQSTGFYFLYLRTKSRVEFLTILGSTALTASSYTGQKKSFHHQNLVPSPKTAFDIAQILFATFYFVLRVETLVDLLTFKCKE